MSIRIKEHINGELEKAYDQYDLRGGSLLFTLWELSTDSEKEEERLEYNIHKVVARQTIDKVNYQTTKRWNNVVTEYKRSEYPNLQVDYDLLDNSGIKITPKEFLGYAYNWNKRKPLVKGKNINTNWFFEFDKEEVESNKIEIDYSSTRLENLGLEFTGGFVQAFLYPPYSMKLGETIKESGEYINHFMKLFFDNLSELEVYSWSIDCTQFFNSGKEWWGSYFWTVYNKTKNIYIGIVGSDSD